MILKKDRVMRALFLFVNWSEHVDKSLQQVVVFHCLDQPITAAARIGRWRSRTIAAMSACDLSFDWMHKTICSSNMDQRSIADLQTLLVLNKHVK